MLNNASLDFVRLIQILRQQKVALVLGAVAMTCLSVLVVGYLPRQFSADGALLAGLERASPETGAAPAPASADRDLATTLSDILKSPGLLAGVVQRLDLAHAPDLQPATRLPGPLAAGVHGVQQFVGGVTAWLAAWTHGTGPAGAAGDDTDSQAGALRYLQKNLKVVTNEHSDLLSIQFRAGSAVLAADVVNEVMKGYVDLDRASGRDEASHVRQWFLDRAHDVEAQIQADNRQIDKVLQDSNVVEVPGGSVAAVELSAAQGRLAAAREELTRRQASLDTARQMIAQNGTAAAAQETLASPIIQSLTQREAELVQRLGSVSGLPFPLRAKLEDELRSVRGQIATETSKIVTALTRETEIARTNVAALEQAVLAAEVASRRSSSGGVSMAQLSRDIDAKRQLYDTFISRAQQADLASEQPSSARILFRASPPKRADRPSALMAALFGLVAGLFLTATGIILRNLLRARVASPEDISLTTGLTVLGSLPTLQVGSSRLLGLSRLRRQQAPVAETLRGLWLTMRRLDGGCTTALVTSSEVGEGKTTVAVALARQVAADGYRVMLIDADLRHPSLLKSLGLRPGNGLVSLLSTSAKLEDAVAVDPVSGMHCLLGDRGVENPIKLLASKELQALIATLRLRYDLIVLDSPPLLRVADASLLFHLSQFTLFLVEHGRMSQRLLAEAVSRLPGGCDNRTVALMTRVPERSLDRRGHYGGYTISSRHLASQALGPDSVFQSDAGGPQNQPASHHGRLEGSR